MSKYIFRINTDLSAADGVGGLTDTIEHWGKSNIYGDNEINTIPEGNSNSNNEPTSIPSPFARIALVKTAFAEVEAKGERALGAYKKIVSEALDIAEIFFTFNRWKNILEIIKWDKSNLPDGPLGKSLSLFLKSDADAYNLKDMRCIYIFRHIQTGKIIGATSPSTLFFSAANVKGRDKNGVAIPEFVDSTGNFFTEKSDGTKDYKGKIQLSNDHFAFSNVFPLSRRSIEFQNYLYQWFKTNKKAETFFSQFNKYLKKQKNDTGRIAEIDALPSNVNNYNPLDYRGIKPEICGLPLYTEIVDSGITEKDSSFLIEPSEKIKKKLGEEHVQLPLVLPLVGGNGSGYEDWKLDKNTKWGNYIADPAAKRDTLPNGVQYPWLTISDFLTNTIVRMPYMLNNDYFFNGHYICMNEEDPESFLLPLTETFFKFFTTDDLQNTKVSGSNEKMFEFKDDLKGIIVKLRIPIVNNNYIEYERTYVENPDSTPDIGRMIVKHFGLGIMPFVKFPESVEKKEYQVPLMTLKDSNDVKLSFLQDNTLVNTNDVVRKKMDSGQKPFELKNYAPFDNFNRINVNIGDVSGIIIPKMKDTTGSNIYTFAIDFGTTNTHIAYCTSTNAKPEAFSIQPTENKLCRMHINYRIAGDDSDLFQFAFAHNFIPESLQYPMRTVFAEREGIDYKNALNLTALIDGNIPFLYEKEQIPDYNKKQTEIKWDCPNPLRQMYLENLFKLLQMKVVANAGDLNQVRLIWSYPASFTPYQHGQIYAPIWTNLFIKYFGGNNLEKRLISLTESTAPWFNYKVSASGQTISIDVGGGTTDVYVLEKQKPKMLLSFKFASNALFGDAYGEDCEVNGFYQLYYEKFLKILNDNGDIQELARALNQIKNQKSENQLQHTPDIIAFLFSLVNNPQTRKPNGDIDPNLDLSQMLLEEGKMKYVFILFYGAIVYYVAKAMKIKGIQRPAAVVFSGNGSKTLNILSPDNTILGKFIQYIFDGVYNEVESDSLKIHKSSEPKEATSKGCIQYCLEGRTSQTPAEIDDIKCTLLGNDMTVEYKGGETYQQISNTETTKDEIVQSVIDYIEFIFKIHESNKKFFINSFGADPNKINNVKDFCKNKTILKDSLNMAINKVIDFAMIEAREKKQKDVQPIEVEETLFFYPLIKTLHDLAYKISKDEI